MNSPNQLQEIAINSPSIQTFTLPKWMCQLLLCALISVGCSPKQGHRIEHPTAMQSDKGPIQKSLWKIVIDSRQLGPLEAYLHMEHEGDSIRGFSSSGIIELIRTLPGDNDQENRRMPANIFSFEATRDLSNSNQFVGRLTEPWNEEGLILEFEGENFSGTLNHWLLGGSIQGQSAETIERIRDYEPVFKAFDRVVQERVFDPKVLEADPYLRFRDQLKRIARLAQNDLDMALGFHFTWNNDPFSHFQLRRSEMTSQEMFESFDQMQMGYEAARVVFEEDLAILRVDTMMGQDTITQIKSAYHEIQQQQAKRLIIDLRGNGGGAFAVKPLVEHVIDTPFESGYFLSRPWFNGDTNLPTVDALENTTAWQGWSISAFWHDVQRQGVMKLQFEPAEPNFDGPVYVLLDQYSASATELAADAFRSSGNTILVGERTAGEMLSQSFFDLVDGFIISLPVADYYSMEHGRIEGVGVPVDIPCSSEEALNRAKSHKP